VPHEAAKYAKENPLCRASLLWAVQMSFPNDVEILEMMQLGLDMTCEKIQTQSEILRHEGESENQVREIIH